MWEGNNFVVEAKIEKTEDEYIDCTEEGGIKQLEQWQQADGRPRGKIGDK